MVRKCSSIAWKPARKSANRSGPMATTSDGADRGVDRVAAADPVPEPERVGRVDAEVGHLVEGRRDRHEVLGHGRRRLASASIAPDARRASSSQALQSRALVSVSSVPKVLLDDDEQRGLGLQVGQRGGRVGRVDVGDEPALQLGVPVGGEGLVGHHRAEVGAADPDVHDRPDPLAGDPGPRPAAHLLGEGVDAS